jgi:hypothetical protein
VGEEGRGVCGVPVVETDKKVVAELGVSHGGDVQCQVRVQSFRGEEGLIVNSLEEVGPGCSEAGPRQRGRAG